MKYKTQADGQILVKKDYSKRVIFSLDDFNAKGHLLQTVTIPAQTKQRMHFHHKQTEVFYILEGQAVIIINRKEYVAKPGDAFICEPQDKHFLWNKTNRDFTLVVFKINMDDKSDDTEWVES